MLKIQRRTQMEKKFKEITNKLKVFGVDHNSIRVKKPRIPKKNIFSLKIS